MVVLDVNDNLFFPLEYSTQASREGWDLFTVDGLGPLHLAIQKIDDPTSLPSWKETDSEEPIFSSDKQAIKFVKAQAKKNHPHAILALELHGKKIKMVPKKY